MVVYGDYMVRILCNCSRLFPVSSSLRMSTRSNTQRDYHQTAKWSHQLAREGAGKLHRMLHQTLRFNYFSLLIHYARKMGWISSSRTRPLSLKRTWRPMLWSARTSLVDKLAVLDWTLHETSSQLTRCCCHLSLSKTRVFGAKSSALTRNNSCW